ncbi:cytochrome P450 4F3-like [Protopterus annectens]|uniref:cytochrome P450 4F3-like n=1 Tax=Protopterus annectens TaxID=7888 RepID=UPI001CFC34A3|nr:cytochrome P450 4F3-like [Protopterus annectens]
MGEAKEREKDSVVSNLKDNQKKLKEQIKELRHTATNLDVANGKRLKEPPFKGLYPVQELNKLQITESSEDDNLWFSPPPTASTPLYQPSQVQDAAVSTTTEGGGQRGKEQTALESRSGIQAMDSQSSRLLIEQPDQTETSSKSSPRLTCSKTKKHKRKAQMLFDPRPSQPKKYYDKKAVYLHKGKIYKQCPIFIEGKDDYSGPDKSNPDSDYESGTSPSDEERIFPLREVLNLAHPRDAGQPATVVVPRAWSAVDFQAITKSFPPICNNPAKFQRVLAGHICLQNPTIEEVRAVLQCAVPANLMKYTWDHANVPTPIHNMQGENGFETVRQRIVDSITVIVPPTPNWSKIKLILQKEDEPIDKYLFRLTEAFEAYSGYPEPTEGPAQSRLSATFVDGLRPQFQLTEYGLSKLNEYLEQYSDCCPIYYGPVPFFICLVHPDYIQPVLSASAHMAPKMEALYRFFRPWLGDGLLVANGDKWHRNRRLLTSSFHFDILKPYMKIYNTTAQTMLDKWEKLSKNNQSVELFEHVSLMSLDTLLQCAFSYDSNCQTQREIPYIRAVNDVIHLFTNRATFPPYHSDLLFYLSPSGYRFRKALGVLHSFSKSVIKKRKESLVQLQEDLKTGQFSGTKSGKKHLDFLDMLLLTKDEFGAGLTNEEIENEVDVFMFGGHDTTASGISWLLYNLAKHPEYQLRCRQEIEEVLQGRNEVEWEDLSKLFFTTMCIKESLRTHPPVVNVCRTLKKDVELPDGRIIPKGMNVSIVICAVHQNPRVWDNPEVYNPYRFTPENSAGRSSYAFIPFAAGPRNCIGQNFAMNEMKVTVALILQRYWLTVDESVPVERIPELILRAKNGIHLFLQPKPTAAVIQQVKEHVSSI